MAISKEEIQFMSGILLNGGKLSESDSLALQQTSWLNRYADQGYWQYGLNITGGWLTEAGKDYFIEILWEHEGPQCSTRLETRIVHLTRCLDFAKEKLKVHQDNLSIDQIERMEAEWPDSVDAAPEQGNSTTAS